MKAILETAKFAAGASFRIYGMALDFEAVTRELGFTPDHQHRMGDLGMGKKPYPHDMWSLASPLSSDKDLNFHVNWLADRFLPRREYILSLKEKFKVDVYCWKNCFTEQASLRISSNALTLFTAIGIDLDVTLLCLPPESRSD